VPTAGRSSARTSPRTSSSDSGGQIFTNTYGSGTVGFTTDVTRPFPVQQGTSNAVSYPFWVQGGPRGVSGIVAGMATILVALPVLEGVSVAGVLYTRENATPV